MWCGVVVEMVSRVYFSTELCGVLCIFQHFGTDIKLDPSYLSCNNHDAGS